MRHRQSSAVSTDNAGLQWVQTGITSSFPKYGVYAAYSDTNNNVSVWIDIQK
jgi:hypothetical protein